jgi:biotin operon repressor
VAVVFNHHAQYLKKSGLAVESRHDDFMAATGLIKVFKRSVFDHR